MRPNLFFTTALCFMCLLGLSQKSSFDLKNYNPVSPNAANLGQFGIYPISKNLGTASVSIPIYVLKERNLNVPISLNYNTSGIRLNDLASWVGLGWSLNAGGAIVRNVKGLPDRSFNDTIPNLQNALFNEDNFNYLEGTGTGFNDTAPDQYVLNALGRTATFYLDQNNDYKASFEDGSPIEVIPNPLDSNEIKVILEDGTLLVFGRVDSTTVATEITDYHHTNYLMDYVSAWYLTKLISRDRNHTISFKYKSRGKLTGYSEPASETIYIDGSFPDSQTSQNLKAANQGLVVTSRQFLEEIIFENGHIDFESSLNNRPDLSEDYQLDAIKVYTNDTGTDELIDEFHFTYGEFARSGGAFSLEYNSGPIFFDSPKQEDSRKKALKLTSMYRGASASTGEVHSFEYNATNLPERCTTAQDSWGYPNTNQGSLLPSTQVTWRGINDVIYTVGDGDRSVNESKMKASILEKITYPTGGYTVFEFEANRYSTNEIAYVPKYYSATGYGSECTDPSYPHYEETTFTIPSGAKNIRLHIDMSPVLYQGGTISYVSLDSKVYNRPTPDSHGGPSDSSDGWTETIDLPFGTNLGDPFNPVIFQSGSHTIKAFDSGYGPFAAYPCSRIGISISWEEPNGTQQVDKLVGGLRIKSISNYDGTSPNPVLVKTYEYEQPNLIHPEVNRGYVRNIILDPGFALNPLVSTSPHFNNNLGGEPVISYDKVTEYEYDPVSTDTNGKTVSFYETVPQWRSLNSLLGPQVFKHSAFSWSYYYAQPVNGNTWNLAAQQLLLDALEGPDEYSFFESTSWRRNKLKREEVYKTMGQTDVLVSKTENTYSTIETNTIFANHVFSAFKTPNSSWQVTTSPYNQGTDLSSIQFCYQVDEIETGSRVLSQTKNTIYDTNGLNPLTTVTDYYYDNLTHKQPTRVVMSNSHGESIETKTYYPDDVVANSSLGTPDLDTATFNALSRLKTKSDTNPSGLHRISEPIQVETLVKDDQGTVLSRTVRRTDYEDMGNDLVLPKKVKSLKGNHNTTTNPMEERISYTKYDDFGNVIELRKTNGSPVSYIWGYNKMYPVAKVENVTRATIEAALSVDFHAGAGGLTTPNENTLRGLSGALVTTFTYDPMVGLLTQTDPSGYTTHYHYDGFNRLKEVRDADNKIVTDYEYHYKGQ